MALNCSAKATGDGCGGKKPCVTDNAAKVGRPKYTAGKLYLAATVITNGTNNTKPTP